MNKNTINLSFLQTIRRIVCPQGYVLKNVLHLGSSLCFQLHSKYKRRPCPICGTMSSGRHGTYIRTLQDMPLCGYPVTLEFTLYKYYCKASSCKRKIFSERIPSLPEYSRNTSRLDEHIRDVSCRLTSVDSSRILFSEGVRCSPSTCIRKLGRAVPPDIPVPTAIGIDDFAWKKGHTYGSVQVNLLNHKPVDVLGERDSHSVYLWFLKHPGIRYVSRDGSIAFKEAISRACPHAEQIRDRFHLVKDLSEYINALVARLHRRMEWQTSDRRPSQEDIHGILWAHAVGLGDKRRREKLFRFQRFNELKSKGYSIAAISRNLGIDSSYVKRHQEIKLDRMLSPNQRNIIRHIDEIADAISCGKMAGEHDIAAQYPDIREEDLKGLDKKLDECKKKICSESGKKRKISMPSKKEIFRTFFRKGYQTTQPMLKILLEGDPRYRRLIQLCLEFREMMNGAPFTHTLDKWIKLVHEQGIKECSAFCRMIELDWQAVLNAIELPFSNGVLEGTVNKIKTIKRMMYGAAKVKLLKMKLLNSTST